MRGQGAQGPVWQGAWQRWFVHCGGWGGGAIGRAVQKHFPRGLVGEMTCLKGLSSVPPRRHLAKENLSVRLQAPLAGAPPAAAHPPTPLPPTPPTHTAHSTPHPTHLESTCRHPPSHPHRSLHPPTLSHLPQTSSQGGQSPSQQRRLHWCFPQVSARPQRRSQRKASSPHRTVRVVRPQRQALSTSSRQVEVQGPMWHLAWGGVRWGGGLMGG